MKTKIHIPPGALIDPFLKAHRRDTQFLLGPGEYYCSGSPEFRDHDWCCLGPGCELRGAGSGKTTVRAIGGVAKGAYQYEFLTAGSRSSGCDFVAIIGLHLDVSFDPAPESEEFHSASLPDDVGRVGLHVWSENSIVRNVSVSGIVGHEPRDGASREGFGILINQSKPDLGIVGPFDNHLIENCAVEMTPRAGPDMNFSCGVYVGLENPTGISIARRIRVGNMSAQRCHAAFASNGGVQWSQCENHGRFDRAIYCDVTGGSDVLWSDCRFHAEREFITLHAGGDGRKEHWRDYLIRDCHITMDREASGPYAAIMVLRDLNKKAEVNSFNRVEMRHCTIHNKATVPTYAGSWDAKRTAGCGMEHCRWVGNQMLPAIRGELAPGAGFIVGVEKCDEA